MRRSWFGSTARTVIVLLCCSLAVAACRDDLTGPSTQAHPAGGRLWVAITPPEALPDAATWLPFVAPRRGPVSAVERRVRELRDEARILRRRGDLEGAIRAEEEAARAAVESLSEVPDRMTVLRAIDGVDGWVGEAEAAVQAAPLPEVEAALAEVRAARAEAAEALARADTLEAVRHLALAASAAREQAPGAVALRVFARVEAAVRERELPSTDRRRVEHLLRWAREAVLTGDPERAFRRAVYALQLLDAHGE
ncbi:MAG TPA: hypothetical protein VHG28_02935 [Longimicrobiaceae bacterium]|nr:hypothetical protein [Longimicrobiaceae bacterium]